MKFGKYKIDSSWFVYIIGFLLTSLIFPHMFLSVILLLIFAIEKDDNKD